MEAAKDAEPTPNEGRVILVGIAGTTRSGKSTLASRLQENFPHSIILHADRYWQVRKPIHEETGFPNWECPEAVDYVTLGKFIDESIVKARQLLLDHSLPAVYIFVEGFLLFASEAIRTRFDYEIFLTISKRSCWTRRQTTKPVPARYFESILWPSFVKYNSFDVLLGETTAAQNQTKLLLLDSDSMDAVAIYKAALDFLQGNHVESHIESHKRNLVDTTDLSRQIAFFEEINEMMTPEEEASTGPIDEIISRRKELQLEALRARRKTTETQDESKQNESKPSCSIL